MEYLLKLMQLTEPLRRVRVRSPAAALSIIPMLFLYLGVRGILHFCFPDIPKKIQEIIISIVLIAGMIIWLMILISCDSQKKI